MVADFQTERSLFLKSLSLDDRKLVLAHCRPVPLRLHAILYEPGEIPSHAYLITAGFASIVTSMPDGATVEVGVIGREGVAGSIHLLGPSVISTRCLVQLEGTALAIPLARLAYLFAQSTAIRGRLLEFVQSQDASLGQIAACHRLHLAEERLARWLLMVQDRVESDVLDLTQEFLADMLGSRRTTVTKAAGILEEGGAIEFRRGRIRIVDRQKLVAAACLCYPVVRSLLTRLYGRAEPVSPGLIPRKLAM
jgi:CRP-like cAMP-binding protein